MSQLGRSENAGLGAALRWRSFVGGPFGRQAHRVLGVSPGTLMTSAG